MEAVLTVTHQNPIKGKEMDFTCGWSKIEKVESEINVNGYVALVC